MKLRNNKKALAVASLLLVAVITVAGVIAYFSQSDRITNHFSTVEPSIYLDENFNPGDKWVPGETKKKEVKFGNSSDFDTLLRFRLDVSLWDDKDPSQEVTPIPTGPNQEPFYTLIWNNNDDPGTIDTSNWYISEKDGVIYYYYKHVLESGTGETPLTLKGIKFADWISNDTEGIWKDYSNYTLKVDVHAEMIQTDEDARANAIENDGWLTATIDNNNNVNWSSQK